MIVVKLNNNLVSDPSPYSIKKGDIYTLTAKYDSTTKTISVSLIDDPTSYKEFSITIKTENGLHYKIINFTQEKIIPEFEVTVNKNGIIATPNDRGSYEFYPSDVYTISINTNLQIEGYFDRRVEGNFEVMQNNNLFTLKMIKTPTRDEEAFFTIEDINHTHKQKIIFYIVITIKLCDLKVDVEKNINLYYLKNNYKFKIDEKNKF